MLAAIAPIIASGAIYAVTRSPFALVFAFLGPIVALASYADGLIRRRRQMRAGKVRFDADTVVARHRIDAFQEYTRSRLNLVDPSIHELLHRRGRDPGRWAHSGAGPVLVAIGRGRVASGSELGSSRPAKLSERSEVDRTLDALVEAGRWIDDAPIVLDATHGIAVCGASAGAQAMARAIVVRLARLLSPLDVELRSSGPAEWDWLEALPHRKIAVVRPRAPEFATTIEFVRTGIEPLSVQGRRSALVARLVVVPDVEVAPQLGAVIVVESGGEVWVEVGSDRSVVAAEFCTQTEAVEFAAALSRYAGRAGVLPADDALLARVEFATLDNTPRPGSSAHTLACELGVTADGPWIVDLVTEGPHAVIGGTTGSGKSELLVSWVLALAGRYPPNEVSVLLVDFKGGAAFAQVASLTHTAGVLSDLDAMSARRAIQSLTAEVLRRERTLSEYGVRSIGDLPSAKLMSRLVVFVDEFAVLAHDFPDLREIFVDLAARGRSLGVHLVLCTQRPAEVVRDAILANVTLRVSLRVNDRAQSTALLGTPIAAALPRTVVGRAAVSIAGDEPRLIQVAIAGVEDVLHAHAAWPGIPPARRPWCDALPPQIGPDHPLVAPIPHTFAVADLPARQTQSAVGWAPRIDRNVVVQGSPRSGRSTAIAALVSSWPDAIVHRVHDDIERAFDQLSRLAARVEPHHPGANSEVLSSALPLEIVVIDDLDHLASQFAVDHYSAFIDVLGRLMRDGPAHGVCVVIAGHRFTGALNGLVGLCDSRLLMRMSSRQDHLLAHGVGDDYDERLPPGGGWWKGDRVQVVTWPPPSNPVREPAVDRVTLRTLQSAVLAVVTSAVTAAMSAMHATHDVVDLREQGTARSSIDLVTGSAPRGTPRRSLAIVGDLDSWHLAGPLLAAVRGIGLIVVHGYSVPEFRAITRVGRHPPPLASSSTRAWVLHGDGAITRCSI